MRKLIIRRKKTIVASANKMYVYLYDMQGTVQICGAPHRLVGTVKNGKEIETEIPTDETYVAVCYWASENFFPALFTVPRGEEDVYLNAKPKFNPFKGNPILLQAQPRADEKEEPRGGPNG